MIATRSDKFVLVVGSANVDFVVKASHIPAPGETVLGEDLAVVPGGKGANQAVACARSGGVSTTLLAALGDDVFAPVIEKSLAIAGVRLKRVSSTLPTGAALITVSCGGENAITVAPGANGVLTVDNLPSLDDVSWLVLQLETPLETVAACAAAAQAAGVKVMLNAAPAQPLSPGILAMIDLLVVNEEELGVVVGAEGSIQDRLNRVEAKAVIVTLGAKGCCAKIGDRFLLQPAFPVSPVDTTAAGDTFCGTLAAALSAGEDMPAAMRRAAAAAAISTTKAGAQTSIAARDDVEAFLRDQSIGPNVDALARYCEINI